LRAVLTLSYKEELSLTLKVLFVGIRILPKKDKRKKIRSMSRRKAKRIRAKLAKEAEKKRLKAQEKKQEASSKKKRSLKDILDTVDFALSLIKTALGHVFGHISVRVARFKITVGTPDPVSTALAYGALSQVLSYIATLLESNKRIKGLKRADISLESDFLSETFTADIKLSFSLRVWQLIHIAAATLLKAVKKNVKKQNEQTKKG
jgi:hypothetical protein